MIGADFFALGDADRAVVTGAFTRFWRPDFAAALAILTSKRSTSAEVTFRLRYEPSGTIIGVTIDSGPPNISPGFIHDSTTIIKGMLVLPPSMTGGVMNFTDLDADSGIPYR